MKIPEELQDLLDKKALAHLATIMPDGSPQVTPVWFDYDGEHFRINSARGRRKDRNMRRDPRVALSIVDPESPEHSLCVRGTVVAITTEGALAHMDTLARKYRGSGWTPVADQVRVIYKIRPDWVNG